MAGGGGNAGRDGDYAVRSGTASGQRFRYHRLPHGRNCRFLSGNRRDNPAADGDYLNYFFIL